MFWPKNTKRYENLKSSFTNLERLIDDLDKSGFNGFLEVVFDHERYYIPIGPNRIERIYTQNNSGRFVPAKLSLGEIYKKSLETIAVINLYDVESDRLEFIVSCLSASPMYTNLSSEFTDFDKLLNRLSKDGLDGYLEVIFQDSSIDRIYLLCNKGKIEDIFWGKRQLDGGKEHVDEINRKLRENEAQFNVYYVMGKARPKARGGVEYEKKSIDNVTKNNIGQTEFVLEPLETEQETGEILEGMAPTEVLTQSQSEIEREELKEGYENALENLSIAPYLSFVGALIQWFERGIDQNMGKNYFSKAFKKGLLNTSDKYPFLDPFLAEFTYLDGKVNFTGEAKAIEFLRGIYTAIEAVFEELTGKERNNIMKTLKQTLRELERDHHEEIEILRVRTLMRSIFQ